MREIFYVAILIATGAFVHAQVGIGTSSPKATLDITALNNNQSDYNVDGVLIPRVDRKRAHEMVGVTESTLIYIDNIDTGEQIGQTQKVDTIGFYYYKNNSNGNNGVWIKLGSEYAKPEFFYMPSVILPTYPTDELIITDNQAYKETAGLYEVDLYTLFSRQFLSPLASSPVKTSSDSNDIKFQKDKLDQFIKTASDYHYYIVYADQSLFTDIKVDTNGKLSYKIKPNSVIKNGSFMNIVLKVK